MRYPFLNNIPKSTSSVETFRGYNHNRKISEGESYEETNMSSDGYPCLTPRGRRGIYARTMDAQGLIEKDSLCWVEGSKFWMNGYAYELNLSERPEDNPKQLVSMGAYVIILPDKAYINTANTMDCGRIEASKTSTAPVKLTLCREDGTDYENVVTAESAPANPSDGEYWIDSSTKPNGLKQWSEATGVWNSIPTSYIKLTSPDIGAAFRQYDGVTITGWEAQEDEDVAAISGSFVLWQAGTDYIMIPGMLSEETEVSQPVTVARRMPKMDYIIESGNRLWGCRYGPAENGEIVNEIYASKLGDFKNWNVFMGISTDSYVAGVGTDGQWTGAVNYLGYPLFFKENHMHKVYGSYPANYQIQETVCRGVQKGSSQSLSVLNETLFYKSRTGVCAYDGSLPAEISQALGDVPYSQAVAGGHDNKYCISMQNDRTGEWELLVYDALKGIWHKEDNTRVRSWCSARNEMYFIDAQDGTIKTMGGSGEEQEEPVKWEAITGEIGLTKSGNYGAVAMPEGKYISRLTLRLSMEQDAEMRVAVEYDSSGIFEHVASLTSSVLRSFSLPIRPKRCDHLRLRLSGTGKVWVYSVAKTVEGTSEKTGDHNGEVLEF